MSNIFERGKILNISELIDYSEEGVVSKQIMQNNLANITLFSFDKGQGLAEHISPSDVMMQVLDGEVEIEMADKFFILGPGETMIIPENMIYSLFAVEKLKILLTMIRGNHS